MHSNWLLRVLMGLFIALGAAAIAGGAGAPIFAILIAHAGGAACVWLLQGRSKPGPAAPVPIESTGLPPLPDAPVLLDAIDDPMLIVRNRRVLLANKAARAVLGEHIEGVDVRLAIRHPAAAERLTDRAERGEETTRTELVGLGERDRRWEMTTELLSDGSRLVRLTDRSEAFASEQMRNDFVANASHELRTPLATLLGFLETLQDEDAAPDAPTRARFIGIMFDEARRMQQLVDDLISLSRIEGERFSLPRESVPLLPLVEETRTNLRHLIDEKQNPVLIDDRHPDPVVLGDPAQLQQMLQNLLVNALKYGRAGEEIVVRIEEAGADMIRMSVNDRGEGIAPEHLPRLTERFYRIDNSRSRAMGGTGLGLAIVKHIVGRHRGRLDIRSRVGEGTSVRVYLPKAPAPLSSKRNESVT